MKLFEYLSGGLQRHPQAPANGLTDNPAQLAAAVLLVELSRGHPDAKSGEIARVVGALRQTFVLEDDAARTLLVLAETEAVNSIDLFGYSHLLRSEFSEMQKEALLASLWTVALSDDAIDHYEEQYIAKIAALLAVPNVRHLAIKHRVLGSSGKGQPKPAGC
jgi:uncharacterized tellurite resistance protein B-like protein